MTYSFIKTVTVVYGIAAIANLAGVYVFGFPLLFAPAAVNAVLSIIFGIWALIMYRNNR